jgi:hypothetical protein
VSVEKPEINQNGNKRAFRKGMLVGGLSAIGVGIFIFGIVVVGVLILLFKIAAGLISP